MGRDDAPRARFVAPADGRWRDDAACRHADPDLFFPDPADTATVTNAVAVCRSCAVIEACLTDALDTRERYGIRGGLTPQHRMQLLAGAQRTAHHNGRQRSRGVAEIGRTHRRDAHGPAALQWHRSAFGATA